MPRSGSPIPAPPPRLQYLADGVRREFFFPFAVTSEAELEVYLADTRQTSGFALTGIDSREGGTVIFDAPPTPDLLITLRRQLTIQRTSAFQESAEFRDLGLPRQQRTTKSEAGLPAPALADITAAPPTAGVSLSQDFAVTVNGTRVPVYQRLYSAWRTFVRGVDDPNPQVNGAASFVMGRGIAVVSVTVANRGAIRSAKVVPSRYGVTTSIADNVVTFTLPRTRSYELQINGSEEHVLYLHANPPIADEPPASGGAGITYYTPGTIAKRAGKFHYFGPGVYTVPGSGRFFLGSNETVYLADGAVFRGKFVSKNPESVVPKSNIRIFGYGCIDGSIFNDFAVWMHDVSGLRLEGFTSHNPGGWTHKIFHCTDVTIDNVKAYSYRTNGDGLDIVACQRFEVKNFFARVFDDGICIKSFAHANDVTDNAALLYPSPLIYSAAQNNVSDGWVHDCFISADVGNNAIGIGYETGCKEVRNIKFEDIDVVHSYHKSVIGIHIDDNSGIEAKVHDITFRRVYSEDHHGARGTGEKTHIHFRIVSGTTGAKISNIVLQNISFTGTMYPSRMTGLSPTNNIDQVHFIGVKFNGVPVRTRAAMNFNAFAYTTNLTFA